PDAHTGMARCKLEQSYDVRGADAEIDKALAANPNHIGALLVRAEMQIDNGEHNAAARTVDKILAIDPQTGKAHTLLATVHWLEDDQPGYEAEKQKVFAINPVDTAFYHTLTDFAVKEHRYKEAIALDQEALKLDAKDANALADIGTGYLRMGD